MNIQVPKLSLVVLIGVSGSGKSTFGAAHFLPTEVLSSDFCRGWISDNPNDQSVSKEAFELVEFIARKRLAAGRLTVIDATNVQPEARRQWIQLAREYHVIPVAIVLNVGTSVCKKRNQQRPDRQFGDHVLRRQYSQLRQSIRGLKREGFRNIFVLDSVEQVDATSIERVKLWNDRTEEHGPFDFIGDVHGCCDELETLLADLGYESLTIEKEPGWSPICFAHPEGRKAVFVGDLVDRGPRSLDVLSLVRNMVQRDLAICVPGNHDDKLLRKLRGSQVNVAHGLALTLAELDNVPDDEKQSFQRSLIEFLDSLVSHYVLDDRKIVVAHAGMREEMQGRGSGKVRSFALYGETTGERDSFGLPVRLNWAASYRGKSRVVYGHTPVAKPQWLNQTINIDTGCVFGGSLTALRYPELEIVSVGAKQLYCEPAKPIGASDGANADLSAQQISDDLLDANDVLGKRIIDTHLLRNITVKEENATAALEVMSRFAVDPKWLIYLPPTMSPAESSQEDGFLEHPDQAFAYFRSNGIGRVMCQEKHMGSRAVVIVCRDAESAKKRFGIQTGESGIVYTRTGRRFFSDLKLESELISRVASSFEQAGYWDQFQTSWVCLDCELMPWSAKAQELLRSQYAAVATAAQNAVPPSIAALQQTLDRFQSQGLDVGDLTAIHSRMQVTADNAVRFRDAYRKYCWSVDSIDDYRLAPFHLLATESQVHSNRDHIWHMQKLSTLCQFDDLLLATRSREVDLNDESSVRESIDWWLEMISSGGEGMVVKPLDFISFADSNPKNKSIPSEPTQENSEETKSQSSAKHAVRKMLIQPAIKCRGKEYLRIIYGMDYDRDDNLKRLRQRSLGRKRSLALREFALGIEGLDRFVDNEPLRRVHECVFGILAMESEPVDPRL